MEKDDYGLEWLRSAVFPPLIPQDPKRVVVIDKFVHALSFALEEGVTGPLAEPQTLKHFSVALENQLYSLFEEKIREYKARVFTLNFNLSDKKNTSLRRRIMQGLFSPASLAVASADQLASEDVVEKRNEQRDKYFSSQVLKRKDEGEEEEGEQQIEGADKRPKIIDPESPSPAMDVDVPDFAQPPAAVSPRQDSTAHPEDTIDDKVDETPEIVPVTEIRSLNDKLREMHEYAKSLKGKLNSIESEPLRLHLDSFIDYFMRHVHE